MKAPLKINSSSWPSLFSKILPSCHDPRILLNTRINEAIFSTVVSTIKIGKTFKSTKPNRFPLTIKELSRLYAKQRPTILDIGASDGSTSLDIIKTIKPYRYYLTDYNLTIHYYQYPDWTLFYSNKKEPIMAANNFFVIYNSPSGLSRNFLYTFFEKYKNMPHSARTIKLLKPPVLSILSKNITAEEYNILNPWTKEKADLVVCANLLNKEYFSDIEIAMALNNIKRSLSDTGYFALIENRPTEQSSVFSFKHKRLERIIRIGHGSDIEGFAKKILAKNEF